MRYRARVYELYNGHKQFNKIIWGYTDAASVEQAGHFLRGRYPYPKYVVEDIMPDPRETKEAPTCSCESYGPAPKVAESEVKNLYERFMRQPVTDADVKESQEEYRKLFPDGPLVPTMITRESIKIYTADFSEFQKGLQEELEHGCRSPETNVTCDNLELTAKIATVHLLEDPEYYTKLEKAMTK